jgi:hypothetical protein
LKPTFQLGSQLKKTAGMIKKETQVVTAELDENAEKNP